MIHSHHNCMKFVWYRWSVGKLLYLIPLLFIGCASLHSDLSKNILAGDPEAKVISLLGLPADYDNSSLTYVRKDESCQVLIDPKDRKVTGYMCKKDPYSLSAGQRALGITAILLKGMGDGIKQQQSTPTCTGTVYKSPQWMGQDKVQINCY